MTETETAVWTNRKWDTSSGYASILISGISFTVTVWPLTHALVLISQIIHKIKKKSDMNVTEKIEDVCDRIFELVDKNKDSK